ncbi:hypothetical protein HK18_04600 [Commensalibacter intestini]|uniref:Uncharacterized protein n=1 Tax=Commensalibacter intestini TaxID=479936 RepID=A0A251ZWY2_9PROT|nr:hypothetical protein HK18_04600 [Commensalibacter intestini]
MKKTNIFLRILGYSGKAILFILDVIISNIELIIYLVGAGIFIYLIYILAPLLIAILCLYYAYISLIALILFIVGIIMAFLFFVSS